MSEIKENKSVVKEESSDEDESKLVKYGFIEYDHAGNPILPAGSITLHHLPVNDEESNSKKSNSKSTVVKEKRKERLSSKKEPSRVRRSNVKLNNSEISSEIVTCSSCASQINHNKEGTVKKHPALNVIICKKCFDYYGNGEFTQDENGSDEFCRWCAEGGNLVCCDFCHNVFCRECIRKNLGRKELSNIDSQDEWHCYICDKSRLSSLISFCDQVFQFNQSKCNAKKEESHVQQKQPKLKIVDHCINSVCEAANIFQKSSKLLQNRYRKDNRSPKNSWKVVKKIQKLMKIQQENVDTLVKMLSSVDLQQLKDEAKAARTSDSETADESKKVAPPAHSGSGVTPSKNEDGGVNGDEAVDGKDACVDIETVSNVDANDVAVELAADASPSPMSAKTDENSDASAKENFNAGVDDNSNLSMNNNSGESADENDVNMLNNSSESADENDVNMLNNSGKSVEENDVNMLNNDSNTEPTDSATKSNDVTDENLEISPKPCKSDDESLTKSDDDEVESKIKPKIGQKKEDSANSSDEVLPQSTVKPIVLKAIKLKSRTKSPRKAKPFSKSNKTSASKKTSSAVRLKKRYVYSSQSNSDSECETKREITGAKSSKKLTPEFCPDDAEMSENDVPSPELVDMGKEPNANVDSDIKSVVSHLTNAVVQLFDVEPSPAVVSDTEVVSNPSKSKTCDESLEESNSESLLTSIENELQELSELEKLILPSQKEANSSKHECDSNSDSTNAAAEKNSENIDEVNKSALNTAARNALMTASSDDETEGDSESSGSENSSESLSELSWLKKKKKTLISAEQRNLNQLRSLSNHQLFNDQKLRSVPVVIVKKLTPCFINKSYNVNSQEFAQFELDTEKKKSDNSEADMDKKIENLLKISGPTKTSSDIKKSHNKPKKSLLSKLSDSSGDDDSSSEDSDEAKTPALNFQDKKNEGKSENEIAKELLADSDDSSCNDQAADEEEENNKIKKKVKQSKEQDEKETNGKNSDPKKPSSEASENEESEKELPKKTFKPCKLLRMKFNSNSSSGSESGDNTRSKKRKEKSTKIKREENSSSDESKSSDDSDIIEISPKKKRKAATVLSDSDSELMRPPLSLGDNSDNSRSSNEQKKTNKRSKKRMPSSSSSDSDDSSNKRRRKKKRSRIKKASDDSDSDLDSSPTKGSQRKNIRRLLSQDKLGNLTKEAGKAEKERRRRVLARQKLYNELTEKISENDYITKKLVLEQDPETEEELVVVNSGLVCQLKPHQVNGVKFLWECVVESVELSKTPGSGCILAHCMGLGKTLTVITFLHTIMNCQALKFERCLVVCPLNTVLNWQNEFNKWLKTDDLALNVFELSSEKRNKQRAEILEKWFEEGGVCILGYEMYRNLATMKPKHSKWQKKIFYKTLNDPGPDIVVCDEGHIIRNSKAGISKAINNIKTLRRIILTGTPLQNNLKEYHCMVSFVKSRLLGTYKEFTNRFMNPIMNGQCADSNASDVKLMKKRTHVLFNLLNGCVQSRDYTCLTKHLTPKFEYVISIRLSDMQLKMYQFYLQNRHEIIAKKSTPALDLGNNDDFIVKKANTTSVSLFYDWNVFQMICNHPLLLQIISEKHEVDEEDSDEYEADFIDDATSESSASSESGKTSPINSDVEILDDSDDKDAIAKKFDMMNKVKLESDQGASAGDKNSCDDEETEQPDEPKEPEVDLKRWWTQFVPDIDGVDDELIFSLSGKITLLFSILSECEAIGDKVLVFSQSIPTLNLIETCLAKKHHNVSDDATSQFEYKSWLHGIDYFRMDGQTVAQKRQRYTEMFNEEDNLRARLFLISTRAGSLGINLVAANRVIIFDASWNPSHDLQAIFRAYRFGQTKPVYIYRFLTQGTMEEKVYDRQVMKQSMSFRVVEEKQMDRIFTMADLADLYSFNPQGTSKHATPKVPKDRLLAEMLIKEKDIITSYHEHDSLLQNITEEELTEGERRAAWAEYEAEKKGLWDALSGTLGPGQQTFNMDAVISRIQTMKPGVSQEELNDDVEKIILMLKKKQEEINREQEMKRREQYLQRLASAGNMQRMAMPNSMPIMQPPYSISIANQYGNRAPLSSSAVMQRPSLQQILNYNRKQSSLPRIQVPTNTNTNNPSATASTSKPTIHNLE